MTLQQLIGIELPIIQAPMAGVENASRMQREVHHASESRAIDPCHGLGRSWMIDHDTPNRSRSMLKRVA